MGPPVMIHTKDGSVYYGELVERVETKGDEHVTVMLTTGVPKRIALKDVDPSPVSLPVMPYEEHAVPMVTVRTLNGSAYHGELIERVVNEHVVLKLETGDMKTIEWADIDRSPPPPARVVPNEDAPVENVRTKSGSVYHGEIVEKVAHDHVTIRIDTGELKTIAWDDVVRSAQPIVQKPREPVLIADADEPNVFLQHLNDSVFSTVCRIPCEELSPAGSYRIAGNGVLPTAPFQVESSARVFASLTTRGVHTAGVVTGLSSGALMVTGLLLVFGRMSMASSVGNDTSAIDLAAGTSIGVGILSFFVAIGLLSSSSHARVTPR
jgi:hypothetical protein